MNKQLRDKMNKHPELEVKFLVTSEEVLPEYYYSQQSIQIIEITEWCEYNDRLFLDISELADELIYMGQCETEEEAEEKASDMMDSVILVRLGA